MGSVQTKLSGDQKLTLLGQTLWAGFDHPYKGRRWNELLGSDQVAIDEAYLQLELDIKDRQAFYIDKTAGTESEMLVQAILGLSEVPEEKSDVQPPTSTDYTGPLDENDQPIDQGRGQEQAPVETFDGVESSGRSEVVESDGGQSEAGSDVSSDDTSL